MASEEENTSNSFAKSKAKSRNEASSSATGKRKLATTTSHADTISGNGERASTKKQKRSQDASSRSTLGGLLNSGLEAASNAIQAVVETVGSFASGSGDKSFLGDATTVATAIAESKRATQKTTAKKVADKSSGSGVAPASHASESPNGRTAKAPQGSEAEDDQEEDDIIAIQDTFDSCSDDDSSGDEGFTSGQKLPKLPSAKGLSKKLKDTKQKDSEPGVIYVGRIPHGFHENEMREYFGQFGTVNHVRLSRNKKTGRSKHYAFLEFESTEVAKIVADTMDKYLMFGHILQCRFVPRENLHEGIWKGADKHFKKIPWAKIEARKLEQGHDREGWRQRNATEELRRAEKAEKLRKIGYEFESPKLADVSIVPVRSKPADEMTEQETSMIASGSGDQKNLGLSQTSRKSKKSKTAELIANWIEENGEEATVTADGSTKDQATAKGKPPAEDKQGSDPEAKPAGTTKKRKKDHRPAESREEGTPTAHTNDNRAVPSADATDPTTRKKRAKGKTQEHSEETNTIEEEVAARETAAKKKRATSKTTTAPSEKVVAQAADALAGVTKPKAAAARTFEDTAEEIDHATEAVGASKKATIKKAKTLEQQMHKAASDISNKATEAATTAMINTQAQLSKALNSLDTMDSKATTTSNTSRTAKKSKSKAAKGYSSAVDQAEDMVASGTAAVTDTVKDIVADEPSLKKPKTKKSKSAKTTPVAPVKVGVTPTEDEKSPKETTATKVEEAEKPPKQKKTSKKRKASADLTTTGAVTVAVPDASPDGSDLADETTKPTTTTTSKKTTKPAEGKDADLLKKMLKQAAKKAKKSKTEATEA